MKILIVDDDTSRSTSLRNYLYENNFISLSDITIIECVDEAKNLTKLQYFDALILDVVLPKRLGEKADYKYAFDFLRQLNRSPKFKKPEKIVGITAYEEDLHNFKAEFENYCLTVIEASVIPPFLIESESRKTKALIIV